MHAISEPICKYFFPPVILNGEWIERIQHVKFLGIYVDKHLNWNQYIKEVCCVLYKVSGHLTTDALLSIYYTLVYLYLHYCIAMWSCAWPSFLNKLVVAQKKILKCIFFLKKYDSTSEILVSYNLLNIDSIHKYFFIIVSV